MNHTFAFKTSTQTRHRSFFSIFHWPKQVSWPFPISRGTEVQSSEGPRKRPKRIYETQLQSWDRNASLLPLGRLVSASKAASHRSLDDQ